MAKIVHSSQRTFERMRKLGWTRIAKVERWVPNPAHPGGGIRMDLWGCFDILARSPAGVWVMVQSCSMSGRAEHLAKLGAPERQEVIADWCATKDHRAEIWAWRRLKVKRGGKAVRWEVERTDLMTHRPPSDASEPDLPFGADLF